MSYDDFIRACQSTLFYNNKKNQFHFEEKNNNIVRDKNNISVYYK